VNISNKSSLRRIMCILLSLTLCIGLCAGADAIPSEMTLEGGESRELGDGYSITVTEIDLRGDKAAFELTKGRARVDSTTAKSGERFRLDYGAENFYFEATLDNISVYTYSGVEIHSTFRLRVYLTGYESGYTSGTGDEDTTDTTPPTVTEKSPTGENVPVATRIAITFSEPMNKGSAEKAVSIHPDASGKFHWETNRMIRTLDSNLKYDTEYTVQIEDAMDLAGNSLYWYEWNFKTKSPNNSPNIQNHPSGSVHGYAGASYSYSTYAKDPDGDQIRYIFDWGDGAVSETEFMDSGRSASQSHVWEGEGEYSVRAMAADSRDGESGWSPPLVVVISERTHPTAAISANPTVITEGETVSFGAGESEPGDPDGEIIFYDWDFGDESTGTGANADHTYARSGHYTTTLTVTDNNNLSATDSVGITVEPTSDLSVSIFTDPVSSGESGEVLVRVTSNGDLIQGASVYLSATTGSLNPNEGATDRNGKFASTFTAPIVDAAERYTIYAEAEMEGLVGRGSESDLIMVEPDIPPTAHIEIYHDTAEEGGSITIEGWGEDEDGDVLGCRWTLPDGTTIPESGDSSELTLEPGEVQTGAYRFTVRDDQGVWSEVAEFELPVPIPEEPEEEITSMQTDFSRMVEYISEDPVALAAVAALAAGALLTLRGRNGRGITKGSKGGGNSEEKGGKDEKDDKDEKPRYGSIHATSTPDDAVVLLDGLDLRGRSPVTISKVPIGLHFLLFVKSDHFGYERKILVTADQTVPVHCDLTKVPEIGLKLSADPTEILADGKSRSVITIEIEDQKGRPIPVPKEIAVVVETNIGEMDSTARISAGNASTTSVLISSGSGGTATVKAALDVDGILKLEGETTVEFVDVEVAA